MIERPSLSLVFEAGFGRREGLLAALRNREPRPWDAVMVDPTGREQRCVCAAEEAVSEIAAGRASHVQWMSDDPCVSWVEIYGPHEQPASPTPWLLSFEYRCVDWPDRFDEVISLPDCSFAVVSVEESLDVGSELNDPESFPWDDWRLVIAVVGGAKGVRRSGAAYSRLT